MTLEEYVLLEKVGLWPEIGKWAREIMSHIIGLEVHFREDAHIVGFSHGGILEPVYAIASFMKEGGQLDNFVFLGMEAADLESSFEHCSGLTIEVKNGKVTWIAIISRPDIKIQTIVK